jgi:ornithine decarboxylase
MMGAYTWASATDFNFFKRAKVVVMNEHADARRVVRLQRKGERGRLFGAT